MKSVRYDHRASYNLISQSFLVVPTVFFFKVNLISLLEISTCPILESVKVLTPFASLHSS